MGIKEWLIPQDRIFYDLFEKQAGLIVSAAQELEQLVHGETDSQTSYRKIRDLEHQGDLITHELYEYLNRTFITPLDPMEISRLGSSLDDILDYIDDSAEKIVNYSVTEFDRPMQDMAQLIRLSAVQIEGMVRYIRNIRSGNQIITCAIEINRLENVADDVLTKAIYTLFQTQDATTIIKLKDIYECMETATDKCEDVANVLSDIGIRHT